MYDGANARVRTPHGNRAGFETGVGLHQGPALSPQQFIIVLDVISEICRSGLSMGSFYADDPFLGIP